MGSDCEVSHLRKHWHCRLLQTLRGVGVQVVHERSNVRVGTRCKQLNDDAVVAGHTSKVQWRKTGDVISQSDLLIDTHDNSEVVCAAGTNTHAADSSPAVIHTHTPHSDTCRNVECSLLGETNQLSCA